jgi:hypothetical protein
VYSRHSAPYLLGFHLHGWSNKGSTASGVMDEGHFFDNKDPF